MPSITQICSKSSSLPTSVHASTDGTQDPALLGFTRDVGMCPTMDGYQHFCYLKRWTSMHGTLGSGWTWCLGTQFSG